MYIETLYLPNCRGRRDGNLQFCNQILRLATMPKQIQRATELTLASITNTFSFLDDCPIVTNGTEEELMTKVKDVLKRLDEPSISL